MVTKPNFPLSFSSHMIPLSLEDKSMLYHFLGMTEKASYTPLFCSVASTKRNSLPVIAEPKLQPSTWLATLLWNPASPQGGPPSTLGSPKISYTLRCKILKHPRTFPRPRRILTHKNSITTVKQLCNLIICETMRTRFWRSSLISRR